MKKNYFFTGIVIFITFSVITCNKSDVQENQIHQLESITEVEAETEAEAEAETFSSYWAMENLRLRETPETTGKEIMTMQKGTMVQKLDTGIEVTINSIKSNWFHVKTETGEEGWCFGGYLTDAKEKAIVPGFWKYGSRSVIFLRSDGSYHSGMLESSGEMGTWSFIDENTIQVHTTASHYDDVDNYSKMAFKIIGNDEVQFDGTVYKRMAESELKMYGIR